MMEYNQIGVDRLRAALTYDPKTGEIKNQRSGAHWESADAA